MATSAVYTVTGMHCASCVRRVESAIAEVPGVQAAAVNLASGTAHVTFAGQERATALIEAVNKIGFSLEPPNEGDQHGAQAEALRRSAMLAGALALPVFVLEMGGHLIPAWHHFIHSTIGFGVSVWIQMVLTFVILAGPGRQFFLVGLLALWRRAPEMNSLVALGTGAAFLFSAVVVLAPDLLPETSRAVYFESAAIIVVFILIGRWLEARAKGQAGAAVREMLALRPDTATVLRDGTEFAVPTTQILVGDEILARPGERIAIDGTVIDGTAYVEEAMITGEPEPVVKAEGDIVIGGTVMGAGSLTYRASAVGNDTYLAGMARLVDEAQAQKLPIQHVLDRVTGVFVPLVIAIALLAFCAWLIAGAGLSEALVAGVSVLIIACPCAMGLATPSSIMVGTGRAAERGILFRRSDALQVLAGVRRVAFDKTGTLTVGKMAVTESVGGDTLRLAAAVEARSEHPIARAIVTAASKLELPHAKDFKAVPGQGAEAFVNGQLVLVGNAEYTGASQDTSRVGTVVYVSVAGEVIGHIALSDEVKLQAAEAVLALREHNISVAMITGDAESSALAVAKKLAITEVHAGVLPEQKSSLISSLQTNGPVAFVGDGINDAPALAQSDVGIAIGTGTDIAIESADVVLTSGDPIGVARAQAISRATMRNIRQNLGWAFGYNVLLIPVAAGVLYPMFGIVLTPGMAAAAMALSSVAVVTNALRLRTVI